MTRRLACAALVGLVLAPGCRSASGGDPGQPPAQPSLPAGVDLAGTWAGTWTGSNPALGPVSGTWELTVTQEAGPLAGSGTVTGVDCPDTTLAGSASAEGVISGQLRRGDCGHNDWVMTALSLADRTVGGAWQHPPTSSAGSFTGAQIARRGGPRIRLISPRGGPPGTIVTVVADDLAADPSLDLVDFAGLPAEPPSLQRPGVLTVRAPTGAATGPVYLTTPGGTGFSAIPFDVAVGAPRLQASSSLDVPGSGGLGAVAISPDGRHAYLASGGKVALLDTRLGRVLLDSLDLAGGGVVHAVAASPDGREVYAAAGVNGVARLDAALLGWLGGWPLDLSGSEWLDPQGLAVSPDGRTVVVSAPRLGGAVSAIDVASGAARTLVRAATDRAPTGVAIHPAGRIALALLSGETGGELAVVDLESGALERTIGLDPRPVAVAVTPDGAEAWISFRGSSSAAVVDLVGWTTERVPACGDQAGLAITPDGARVLLACPTDGTVWAGERATRQPLGAVVVGSTPTGLAVSPDGRRAYLTLAGEGRLMDLGGPVSLSVQRLGSGIGVVVSSPDGIECGNACEARFELGTQVTLLATPGSGSRFVEWGSSCPGGLVTLTQATVCQATFEVVPDGGGGGGGGGCGPAPGYPGVCCFIATAAYGSPLAAEVQVLRDFRDRYLLTNRPGRAFVRAYLALSPPLADFLWHHQAARTAVRWLLEPVVLAVRHPSLALSALAAVALALLAWRARRRSRLASGRAP